MNPFPRVCAVVVTYNRAARLGGCLRALLAQRTAPDHIVVVDNASTDDTADVVRRFPSVEVLSMPENLGSSGGFAAGIAHAATQQWDWVWVMDDDVAPHPDALAALLQSVRPGAVALGSLKLRPDGTVEHHHAGAYAVGRMQIVASQARAGEAPVEVTFLSFVSLLVRGDVARAEQPDARFFIGHDDVEYALRLRRHGTLWLVPTSLVVHYHAHGSQKRRVWGREVAQGGKWRVYYSARNPQLVARRHGSTGARLASIGVGAVRLAGRLAAALLHHGGDLERWTLAARGYADGIRGRSGVRFRPTDYR